VLWWGRWDLNPGSRTPQARILNHARRRPHFLTALQWNSISDLFAFLKRKVSHILMGKFAQLISTLNYEFITLYCPHVDL
jgi:hypothetical protein